MDAQSLRRGLPDATSRVLAVTSRGPVAKAAARVLVAGETVGDAERVTALELEAGHTVSWMPLLRSARAADDIITVRDRMAAAMRALAASGAPNPDLTLDVGQLGVFADDVTAGLLLVSLRELGQAARNLGVTLTLTIADSAYIEAVYVLTEELRQDFPEVGLVLPTRLRTAAADVENQACTGSRVRLTTRRLDPSIGTTSARESGEVFVDATKTLLAAGSRVAFDTDDVLLLDIAASLVKRQEVGTAEVVAPLGTLTGRQEELGHDSLVTRVVVPFGTHPMPYVADLLAGRPSLALTLPNPLRRRR